MTKKVVIIGDLFLDILPSPLPIEKSLVLKDGETFVDRVTFQRGGCAGNFAAVISSLMPEDDIVFITKLGDDANGDFLENQMRSLGVNTQITRSDKGTAITIAVAYQDGERHFITYNGVMNDFSVDDIDLSIFNDVDFLIWRGIWFTPKLLAECIEFLSHAKSRNIPISMDLGFDPFWANPELGDVTKRKQMAISAMKCIDYLFGNTQEICTLTNTDDLDSGIRCLFDRGVKTVVVHMGAEGALIYEDPDQATQIPAYPERAKINPVGTGDTHDAAFIYGLLNSFSVKKAARFAARAAAFSLSNQAGTEITVEAIEKFASSNK